MWCRIQNQVAKAWKKEKEKEACTPWYIWMKSEGGEWLVFGDDYLRERESVRKQFVSIYERCTNKWKTNKCCLDKIICCLICSHVFPYVFPYFKGVDRFGRMWTLVGGWWALWGCVDPLSGCGPFWGCMNPFGGVLDLRRKFNDSEDPWPTVFFTILFFRFDTATLCVSVFTFMITVSNTTEMPSVENAGLCLHMEQSLYVC